MSALLENKGGSVYSRVQREFGGAGHAVARLQSAQESRAASMSLWLRKPAQQPGLPERHTPVRAQLTVTE